MKTRERGLVETSPYGSTECAAFSWTETDVLPSCSLNYAVRIKILYELASIHCHTSTWIACHGDCLHRYNWCGTSHMGS